MNSSDDAMLLDRRRRVLGSAAPLFYEHPLHLVRGDGVWVQDVTGRRYLDCYNNVPHVGHSHPRVVEAVARQTAELNIHTRYLHENVVLLAERLLSTMNEPLSAVTFCCSGTEANELALRIARHVSGHAGIIVSDFSYHGNSTTLAGVTTGLLAPESLAPYARAIAIPDLSAGLSADEALAGLARAVASLQTSGHGVAALLVDTLFSSEGLLELPPGWLKAAQGIVHKAGGFLVADEVQAGFGRTGEAMWGYQSHGVTPDFVTTGKPMGNGYPVAATVTSRELLERFGKAARYFNTFGGNPVACAASLAVLDVIEEEGLILNAARVGRAVQHGLKDLVDKHTTVVRRRGKGLFFGIELIDPDSGLPAADKANKVVNLMREEGVLISRIGPHGHLLKMRPPMPITEIEADFAIERLDAILGNIK